MKKQELNKSVNQHVNIHIEQKSTGNDQGLGKTNTPIQIKKKKNKYMKYRNRIKTTLNNKTFKKNNIFSYKDKIMQDLNDATEST